jgi:hypothetical protein
MSIAQFLTEENLQRLLNQQLAEDQGVASLLPSNVSPFFRMDATGGVVPQQYFRELTGPQIDFGSTFNTPDLTSNIPTIQNPGIPLLQSSQDDLEESAISEFAEGQLKQSPTGIARLFELLGNIPTPFNLVRRGLESLRGLNQRIQQSDFGQSKTLMDYLDARKYGGRQARDDAAARNMAQARGLQKKIDRGEFGTRDTSIDRGRGSIPSRTTSAPRKTSSSYSAANRAFAGSR